MKKLIQGKDDFVEKEFEVKILGVDLTNLEECLIKSGAKFLGEERQENRLYRSAYFEENAPKGSYLRVRILRDEFHNLISEQLTFKQNVGHDLVRENEEYHVQVQGVKNLEHIFSYLGVELKGIGYKLRRSYEWQGVRFDLDRWDDDTYPHPYVELELQCEEDLDKVCKHFQFKKSQVSKKSIVELQQLSMN